MKNAIFVVAALLLANEAASASVAPDAPAAAAVGSSSGAAACSNSGAEGCSNSGAEGCSGASAPVVPPTVTLDPKSMKKMTHKALMAAVNKDSVEAMNAEGLKYFCERADVTAEDAGKLFRWVKEELCDADLHRDCFLAAVNTGSDACVKNLKFREDLTFYNSDIRQLVDGDRIQFLLKNNPELVKKVTANSKLCTEIKLATLASKVPDYSLWSAIDVGCVERMSLDNWTPSEDDLKKLAPAFFSKMTRELADEVMPLLTPEQFEKYRSEAGLTGQGRCTGVHIAGLSAAAFKQVSAECLEGYLAGIESDARKVDLSEEQMKVAKNDIFSKLDADALNKLDAAVWDRMTNVHWETITEDGCAAIQPTVSFQKFVPSAKCFAKMPVETQTAALTKARLPEDVLSFVKATGPNQMVDFAGLVSNSASKVTAKHFAKIGDRVLGWEHPCTNLQFEQLFEIGDEGQVVGLQEVFQPLIKHMPFGCLAAMPKIQDRLNEQIMKTTELPDTALAGFHLSQLEAIFGENYVKALSDDFAAAKLTRRGYCPTMSKASWTMLEDKFGRTVGAKCFSKLSFLGELTDSELSKVHADAFTMIGALSATSIKDWSVFTPDQFAFLGVQAEVNPGSIITPAIMKTIPAGHFAHMSAKMAAAIPVDSCEAISAEQAVQINVDAIDKMTKEQLQKFNKEAVKALPENIRKIYNNKVGSGVPIVTATATAAAAIIAGFLFFLS